MELKEFQVKKLFEENKELHDKIADEYARYDRLATFCEEMKAKYEQEIKELTEENERLQKALNTDISIVRVSRGSGKTAHLREVGQIKVDAIRADTVRKMQELITERLDISVEGYSTGEVTNNVLDTIDQIAKEMLEGEK